MKDSFNIGKLRILVFKVSLIILHSPLGTHDFRDCYIFPIAGLSGATVSTVLAEKAATKVRYVSMMNIVQFVKMELHAGMNIHISIYKNRNI